MPQFPDLLNGNKCNYSQEKMQVSSLEQYLVGSSHLTNIVFIIIIIIVVIIITGILDIVVSCIATGGGRAWMLKLILILV